MSACSKIDMPNEICIVTIKYSQNYVVQKVEENKRLKKEINDSDFVNTMTKEYRSCLTSWTNKRFRSPINLGVHKRHG